MNRSLKTSKKSEILFKTITKRQNFVFEPKTQFFIQNVSMYLRII
jgi:hypothetical protein